MQQLHLVGPTTDHRQLVFSARRGAKSGSFAISLDEAFLHAIEDALRERRGDDDPDRPDFRRLGRTVSQLSPREIQSRLRAGRDIAEVARDAGVDVDWIARFAAPVLAEQAQVIDRARVLPYTTARKGVSAQPLGVAVRWNVADRGVRLSDDEFDRSWSAHQLREGSWIVKFEFVSRRRPQVAEWEVDFRAGSVTARDRLASALAFVAPRARPPAADMLAGSGTPASVTAAEAGSQSGDPEPDVVARAPKGAATKRPAKKRATKKSAAKKRAAKKSAAKKGAANKTSPAKRAAPKKAVGKKGAAKKVGAGRRPATKRAVRKAPAKNAVAKKTQAKKASARKAGAKKVAKRAPAKKAAARRRPRTPPTRRASQPRRAATPTSRRKPPARATAAAAAATRAMPAPIEPRSLRRARRRAASLALGPATAAPALGPGPVPTASRRAASRPATPRVVTIRADRATPPTESQLDVQPST